MIKTFYLNQRLFPLGFQFLHLPEDVGVHGITKAVRFYFQQPRRGRTGRQGQGQLRISHGIYLHRIRDREKLRIDSNWGFAGFEGIRHRHATQ